VKHIIYAKWTHPQFSVTLIKMNRLYATINCPFTCLFALWKGDWPQVYVDVTIFAVWEAVGNNDDGALITFSVERQVKYFGSSKAQRFCHVGIFCFCVDPFQIVQHRQSSSLWVCFRFLTSPIRD